DGIDYQSIAILVMPDRLAIPARLRMRRMRDVEPDMPHLIVALIDHDDFIRPLQEVNRPQQGEYLESGNTRRPAPLARIEGHFARHRAGISALQLFNDPGPQNGIVQIRD